MIQNIIHILPGKANPNTCNGVDKVVDSIATQQVKLGYKTMVIGVAKNTIKRHTPVYEYELFAERTIPFFYHEEMLKLVLENSDTNTIIHFHSVFIPWQKKFVEELIFNNRRHIVLTPHGQYTTANLKNIKKRIFFELFDIHTIKKMSAVHLLGDYTEKNERIQRIASKICVIPNGTVLDTLPEYKYSENLNFGYIGRLEARQKGLDLLMPAFKSYLEEGGRGYLYIAGDGPDKDLIERYCSMECCRDRIIYVGAVYGKDKDTFFEKVSCVVAPSRWEGIPMSCLEAAAKGKPLIVSKGTNLEKYVMKYNAGFCMSNISEIEIKTVLNKFEDLYNSFDLYKTTCDNSYSMIKEELNWESITNRIIKELYELC